MAKTVYTVLAVEGKVSTMPKLVSSLPKYRLHRSSGQAVVTLCGTDIYLGPWRSKASRVEYDRLITEWMQNGRRLPSRGVNDLALVEVIGAYCQHADRYYVKNGRPTREAEIIREVMVRFVQPTYGRTLATAFGPCALKAVRQKMIDAGFTRNFINKNVDRIRRMFRWAASEEMVPVEIYQALATVAGLRKGRTAARESVPVLPVPDGIVDETLRYLPKVVTDMVRFQRLTGCRPGEVCSVRPCDLDRTNDVWAYRPQGHKTEHLERTRVVWIGPQAQAVLLPYLLRSPEAFCFSPIESETKRLLAKNAARVTPRGRGNGPGSNRNTQPKRKPKDHYTKDSYGRAVRRAVDLANRKRDEDAKKAGAEFKEEDKLPRWHPNQLRHAVATRVRGEFGLEAAQVVLGHAKADVTQVYAERDGKLAAEVMRKIG